MTGVVNPAGATYTAPTLFTDGTTIPAGTITKYQLGIGTTSGNYTTIIDDTDLTPNSAGQQFTLLPTNLAFGQYYGAVRAVTSAGVDSVWSTEVPFVVQARVPNAPANFTLA